MPAPMDAFGAFSYLSDNLPSWQTRLSELTAHTAATHAEFAEAFKKHSGLAAKPRRRRNSSVCSIQTSSRPHSTTTGAGSRPHSTTTGAGSQRRKQAADDSSIETGCRPAFVSFRHNLIIHYDGYSQKSLEELVRNIGTARNNLRKGKMTQLPLMGLRSAMGRRAPQASLPKLDSEPSDNQLLSNIRSARARGTPPINCPTQVQQSPFDIADKHLEIAHSLCETAAYRFLRSGDCAEELSSIKDKFSMLNDLATNQVERLRKEQKDDPVDKETEQPEPVRPGSLKRPASSEGPIEVDDDNASVESIDLSAFRVNRMRR